MLLSVRDAGGSRDWIEEWRNIGWAAPILVLREEPAETFVGHNLRARACEARHRPADT